MDSTPTYHLYVAMQQEVIWGPERDIMFDLPW